MGSGMVGSGMAAVQLLLVATQMSPMSHSRMGHNEPQSDGRSVLYGYPSSVQFVGIRQNGKLEE